MPTVPMPVAVWEALDRFFTPGHVYGMITIQDCATLGDWFMHPNGIYFD